MTFLSQKQRQKYFDIIILLQKCLRRTYGGYLDKKNITVTLEIANCVPSVNMKAILF